MGNTRFLNTHRFCAALLLALALFAAPVRAAGELLELLETRVARFIFTETPNGQAIVSRVLTAGAVQALPGEEFSVFLEKLRLPEFAPVREELASTLQELNREAGPEGELGELDGDQRAVLREIAARRLRLNPHWNPNGLFALEPHAGGIDFVGDSSGSLRDRFLYGEDVPDPANAEPGRTPTPEEQRLGTRDANSLFEKMRTCVQNQPPQLARRTQLRYLLTNLGISEAMTVTGYVVGSGSRKLDWKELSTDMLITGLSSMVGSRLIMGNTSFRLRWLRMAAFGQARAGFDAVYYQLTPLHSSELEPDETLHRYEYNATWSAATSIIPVTLYTVMSGLECLYPGAKMASISTGVRLVSSAATSITYYALRNRVLHGGN